MQAPPPPTAQPPQPAAAAPAAAAAAVAPAKPDAKPADGANSTGNSNAASTTASRLQSVSLYVGDLETSVTEQILFDHFKNYGPIASVRVLRDSLTGTSLGYAYVNFSTPEAAEKAMAELNYSKLNGRCCRIMPVNRDPSLRKSGAGNIFIRNLPKDIDPRGLQEIFSQFGPIMSCRVIPDDKGTSRGCAFVHFSTQESANDAVAKMNNKVVRNENTPAEDVKPIIVQPYQHQASRAETYTNTYVKNLKPTVTDEDLQKIFDGYGETASICVMKGSDGQSRGFGFCSFKTHEGALAAVEALHDKPHDVAVEGKNLYVQRAMRKTEREKANRQALRERKAKYAAHTNLYVKNLDDNVTTEKVMEVFKVFGEIASAKVMKDSNNGLSKGFAFVSFVHADDAKKAVKELANKAVLSLKPLYVTYAQTKEERRRQLELRQRQRFNMDGPGGPQGGFGNQGSGPMGGGGGGPQHYGPPQMGGMGGGGGGGYGGPSGGGGGFGGNQGGGMFPGGPQGQRMMGGGGMQQRPQMMGGMGPRQPGGMGGMGSMPGAPGAGMMQMRQQTMQQPMQQGMVRQPMAQAMPAATAMMGQPQMRPAAGPGMMQLAQPQPQPQPQPLARPPQMPAAPPKPAAPATGLDHQQLAALPPDQVRNVLGEKLYHRIMRMFPEQAAKITGMLLEMDNAEIVNLLDSSDLLTQKVHEAVEVLQQHSTE